MSTRKIQRRGSTPQEALKLDADVLVLGGGPAGAWAAVTAALAGGRVVLADKGYFGTSGATAPSNSGAWCVPPGEGRRTAVERRSGRTGGLAQSRHVLQVLDTAYGGLEALRDWAYPFPIDTDGQPYIANLRGPDYMQFMRRRALALGVTVLDHHPALELLSGAEGVAGAAGVARRSGAPWQVNAAATVLATGGCAFGERMLGATGLTGDGYLMAVEAGAQLSGMEFSAQYGIAPAGTSLNKGLIYRWATFFDVDGTEIAGGLDRQVAVAEALLRGPVTAQLDKASPEVEDWLRRGQPNCFLPYDRQGIDPFRQRFAVTLRSEGTVRGVGGVRLADDNGWTGIPGLYAAGDTASREALTGAISGGGGPNASWAIASGRWAGEAAAAHSRRAGRPAPREALGEAGLRARVAQRAVATTDLVTAVQEEMLPLDRNFFRTGAGLERSLARLDMLWSDARDGLAGSGAEAVRSREAAALVATSRWSLKAALARTESRGMHRRTDRPGLDPLQTHRYTVGGLDRIDVAADRQAGEAVAS
jgi:succinate dehydrogenase/fumarate reductase flavoprotein subunit